MARLMPLIPLLGTTENPEMVVIDFSRKTFMKVEEIDKEPSDILNVGAQLKGIGGRAYSNDIWDQRRTNFHSIRVQKFGA